MCGLRKTINNHPFSVMLLFRFRQTRRKVHRKMFLFPSWYIQWMKQSRRFPVPKLHTLTSQAGRYITCYLLLLVIPPKHVLEIFIHFCTSWMHRISSVMSFKHHCLFQIFLCWYTQSISKVEKSLYQYEVWSRCNVVLDSLQFRIFELSILNLLDKNRFEYEHCYHHHSIVYHFDGHIQILEFFN